MADYLRLALCFVLVVLLLGAPFLALVRAGRRIGLDDGLAVPFAFVGIGCIGYASFYLYVASVPAGLAFSGACLAAVAWSLLASRRWRAHDVPHLLPVMALTALFGFTYLAFMYLYVYASRDDLAALLHFEYPRPHDQVIPMMFAEAIYDRLPTRTGKDRWDWYFSDRPPLQAGFALLFSPLWPIFGRPIAYQALATALQTGSLIALWVLTRSLGLGARVSFLAVIAAGTSGFLYYHSVYPWPKLLAATFVFAAMVPLLRAFFRKEQMTPAAAAIAAAAVTLAMLAHSGAIFTLIPLALMLALRVHAIVGPRTAALGALIVAVLYAPWLAYGHFVDPNNNKLIRLHLTDANVESTEPVLGVVANSYRALTFDRWVADRLENFKTQFRIAHLDALTAQLARGVRNARFRPPIEPREWPEVRTDKLDYDVISLGTLLRIDQRTIAARSLGLMNLAWPFLLVLLLRRRGLGATGPPLVFLLALNAATSLLWCVAEFRAGTTVIANASYAMLLIALLCATVILSQVSDRLARVVCFANAALTCTIWVAMGPGAFWPGPMNHAALAAGLAGMAAIVMLIRRAWPHEDGEAAPARA